ncbi:MAG: DNA integrity scanning protein DisA nucleotide-binding domain protein [Methanomicrobiales archaeon]
MTDAAQELRMLEAGMEVAAGIGARAIVSFTDPQEIESSIPIIWVQEFQLDVLRDLTIHDILEVSERHMLDAAVQLYLQRTLEKGKVVGVFPHAIIIYDIEEGKTFINLRDYEDLVPRDVMHAILTLALEIAFEGREGRAVGTAFVVGDVEGIFARSHQAILNPFQGHPPDVCDIKSRDNWESVKEFAQLDGVFLIDRNGQVLSAGRYLDVNARSVRLPGGLGGRHRATAAITDEFPVVGITVSESGGIVRVFRDGMSRLSIRSDIMVRNG